MNPKTFRIRHLVSVGFCLLGFAIPFFVGIGFMARNYAYFGSIVVFFPLWLPVTVLLWLVAAYVAPVPTYRRIGWVVFILGLLISAVWGYLLVGALSH